uniref:Fringe-like glycosyltransferase domain-containing protein n=1 Tax=Pithovirus LCPAC001 TaxID=2506585 RepID=A0A481Z1M5_9VIRU|nr:MAG: uncharacterized protein LCPAC001_01270 [Pithovirus LCPAC001]
MFPPDCTLTTAWIDVTKYNDKCMSSNTAINEMEALLKIPCYLVIFSDSQSITKMKNIRAKYKLNHLTKYIQVKFEDLYCYKYLDIITKNRVIYHPTADSRTCPASHLVTINKIDFVLQTIKMNPFNTAKFGWIDANIRLKASKMCTNYNDNTLLHILDNITDKFHIQIMNVCDKKYKKLENKKEYYEKYRYVVCGGFFTTGKEVGIKILNRLKEIFEETTLSGYGHGEEMLYLEVIDEFYESITRSYGDYKHILDNFTQTNVAFEYINIMILQKYLNFKYYKEAYDCCKHILKTIETYKVEINYNTYISILFKFYIVTFYYKRDESLLIVDHIMHLVKLNPKFKSAFDLNYTFYISQFSFINPNIKYEPITKKLTNLVICVFACATIPKYKNEIIKIDQTWGERARSKDVDVLYFLGEEQTDLIGNNYIYLEGVLNNYESASVKQNLGLKYVHEHYNTNFVLCCGTDAYINIDKLLVTLGSFDSKNSLYIGGHGDDRIIGSKSYHFHSGGSGFVLSKNSFDQIYPYLENLFTEWTTICNKYNVEYLKPACDVSIAYILEEKCKTTTVRLNGFISCNQNGLAYNNTYVCCGDKIVKKNIIVCHSMTLKDFDDFTKELEKNKYYLEK